MEFNFRFSPRKSQSQQKLAKKVTHFTIQFHSKNLIYFTNYTLLNIVKIMLRQCSKNLTHFTNFPANMFLVGVRKNICTAPFLDAQELHSRSTWKQMTAYSWFPQENVCSRNAVSFLSGGGLKASRYLCLVKYFKIFHFNWNFWKVNYFLIFWYLQSIALKCWKFPDNLIFKSNIVAKLLIRSHFLSI